MSDQIMRTSKVPRLFALAVAMLCASILTAGAFAQQAWADAFIDLKEIYSGTKGLVLNHPSSGNYYNFNNIYEVGGSVSAVKVQNPKIFKAVGYGSGIEITVKKTGSTKLTYKLGSKKHTVTINVVKYQNPFASLKVGSKNYKSKFKKEDYASAKPSALKGKLSVSPAKNWKIKKIAVNTAGTERAVKNGTKLKKTSKFRTIRIVMTNAKTGVTETCYLGSA